MKNTFSMLAIAIAMTISAAVTLVRAETHNFFFDNQCTVKQGTPQIVIDGQIVSSGNWASDGPVSGIAYLQTGECGLNGENCATVQFTLINSASDVAISLIPSHALNVPLTFAFAEGCDGVGLSCVSVDCTTALHNSSDQVGQSCTVNDVDLSITFCPNGIQTPLVLPGNSCFSQASLSTSG